MRLRFYTISRGDQLGVRWQDTLNIRIVYNEVVSILAFSLSVLQ